MDAERKLQKCKIDLMRSDKFALLSGILMVGKTEVSDTFPTACTNGRDEFYGREFVMKLTEKELRFVIAHEAGHKMYRHLTTWDKLVKDDGQIANISMDHVINLFLRDLDPTETLIAMPIYRDGPDKGKLMGVADPRFKGMNTKQVFDILKQEDEGGGDDEGDDPSEGDGDGGGDGAGEGGSPGKPKGKGKGRGRGHGGFDEHDHDGAKELSDEEKQELERDIDQAIRQGVITASKSRGNGAGNALLAVEELLRPKVNWREVLRDFVKTVCAGKDKSSWRRPNRRMIGDDVYMPSLVGEKVGRIVLGIDTSGSIGTKELTAVLSEVQGIAEEVCPQTVDVIYWDNRVAAHEEYNDGAVSMITQSTRPAGGGGTAPSCVPPFLKDKQITPECVIMFTDGHVGNNWGSEWPAPVLWLITTKGITAGNGQSVFLEIE